ncbi:hypothetical protein ACJX0J_013704, partial [Zea mays]
SELEDIRVNCFLIMLLSLIYLFMHLYNLFLLGTARNFPNGWWKKHTKVKLLVLKVHNFMMAIGASISRGLWTSVNSVVFELVFVVFELVLHNSCLQNISDSSGDEELA